MKKNLIVVFALMLACLGAQAKVDTLRISTHYTTHVIFATDITYADLSNNKVVAGKIIEQNKNMLALKAREVFTEPCSVSALESNGTMHTFIVVYQEHPSELVIDIRKRQAQAESTVSNTGGGGGNYSSRTARLIAEVKEKEGRIDKHKEQGGGGSRQGGGSGDNVSTWKTGQAPLLQDVVKQPQHLYHIGCKEYDIQVMCEDISSFSDITYMILSLRNNSGISYDIGDATFVIESKGNNRKRTVKYDKTVFPRNRHGKLSAGPGEYTRVAYSFDKLTLSKDQVLRVYLYENEGQRNLVMTINSKDINKARVNR